MVEGRLTGMSGESEVVNAKLSQEFADAVARALLDAKQSREAAEAAAANVPRWRFRLRRKVTRAMHQHASRERRLIEMLGGRVRRSYPIDV